MPIPAQRDPEDTRQRLREWLLATEPGALDVEIGGLGGPASTGFSNETILFDATWRAHGERVERALVARVRPTAHTVFLEDEFESQYRVMEVLSESTDVPVPRMGRYEPDPSWLGAPFFVMEQVDGVAPADSPPYTLQGWLHDATPAQQERLWWSSVDAMAKVHRVRWRELGLEFLDRPQRGATGFEQQLGYYVEFHEWASRGRPQPVAEAALEWLRGNRPPGDEPLGLVWGDARIGNQLFRDFEVVAVLDWEMVTLGNPLQDLCWTFFLDRHHTEGMGVARLPGFPSRDATIRRWSSLTGLPAPADLVWFYEVFAGYRFAVIMMRLVSLFVEFGLMPADTDYDRNNIVTQCLARMLDLPAPGEHVGPYGVASGA